MPRPVTLCVDEGPQLIATIQGWDDDDEPAGRGDFDHAGDGDGDDVLSGVSWVLGEIATIGNGGTTKNSDHVEKRDLRVEFEVSVGPTDQDQDGLSYCEELTAGTDPANADSDGDGINDGNEVGQGMDPLVDDTIFEYAAKMVCGKQENPEDMRLARGFYATTINIHNPSNDVKFSKKLILAYPPGGRNPEKLH